MTAAREVRIQTVTMTRTKQPKLDPGEVKAAQEIVSHPNFSGDLVLVPKKPNGFVSVMRKGDTEPTAVPVAEISAGLTAGRR